MKAERGASGAPIVHDSAVLHVTGRARFTDDLTALEGELAAAPVPSTRSHAAIVAIDTERALALGGVHCVLTAADVPGELEIGHFAPGDPVLAAGEVEYFGQPLAMVVADDYLTARRAARLIDVEYEQLDAVLDIVTARRLEFYVSDPYTMQRGDPDAALDRAPHVLEGSLAMGGQEHFYVEGQVARAIPQDDGGMHVCSSTQHPTEVQRVVAAVLGQPMRQVTVEVRRMGGAFGGKETQASRWACLAAIAAQRLQRPVRMRLARRDDMTMTGKRHAFEGTFRVGFDESGLIDALDLELSADCGHSPDMSPAVVWVGMCGTENCYFLPHARIVGYACRTHKASNTAFRGFGAPQGAMVMEHVIDRIAESLGLDALNVRRRNFYRDGRDITIYGQDVDDFRAPELVDQLEADARFRQRQAEIAEFNATSPVLKRGIALTPVKMGISLPRNIAQGGALVHVYYDGSVHLNHGGTEMGQGLYIKCAQVVADELGVGLDTIQISSARTDKVPNTSATAGSTGTDINGMAAQDAARKLRHRLTEFAAKHHGVAYDEVNFADGRVRVGSEELDFATLVHEAYDERVPLSATGFYAMPKVWFDHATGQGRPFYYFAYGVGCSEVVVDTLTGEYKVLEVDVLQDVGRSLNPAVDLGQVEGAFIQGMGWLTTEELVWGPDGRLLADGPSTYKIPSFGDVPLRFNARLAADRSNPEDTVFRAKAVGEPPLLTAISVFAALRNAVATIGAAGLSPRLDAPATPERVLAAVVDLRTRSMRCSEDHPSRRSTLGPLGPEPGVEGAC